MVGEDHWKQRGWGQEAEEKLQGKKSITSSAPSSMLQKHTRD